MTLRNFNLNLLVVFDAIWLNRNLTQAARALHMTQPGVSTALTRLRQALGDPLFTWDGTSMVPTAKARQLAPQIHALLSNAEQLVHGSHRDVALSDREFVLASADYVFADLGNQVLLQLRRQAPLARLRMVSLDLAMFERAERTGVDLILAPDIGINSLGLERELLYEDQYVGLTASDNDAFGRQPTARQFAALPKIFFNSSRVGLANHESMVIAGEGGDVSYAALTYSYLTIPFLLRQSDCIAMVPARVAQLLTGISEVRTFPLPIDPPPLAIYLFWPASLNSDAHHAWLRRQVMAVAGEACQPP